MNYRSENCLHWRSNLGCDETRDRAGRVGIEVETGALAPLESEKRGASDHRRVVGGEARTRGEHVDTLGLESRSHRVSEGAIAGDSSTQHHALPGECVRRARGLLDEGVDQ